MRSFWNPFTTYCGACVLVVLIYSLDFSSLYPDLSTDMAIFLAFSVISAGICLGLMYSIPLHKEPITFRGGREWMLAGFFLASYTAEFAYSGGVPLLNGLSGLRSNYMDFGIPTFHVFLVGTSAFFSVYWWDSYLVSGNRRYLLIASISVICSLLMLSRGGALINIFAFVFAYGNRKGLRRKAVLLCGLAIAIVLGFGYLGEARLSSQGANLILSIGGANEKFLSSKLPDSTFWFYIYTSSPLANFQYTELNRTSDVIQWIGVVADALPDFISKYFISPEKADAIGTMRIVYGLTVGTAYARPLLTLGWLGPYALHLLFLTFSICAMRFSRGSRYYAAVLALLCAQGGLMFFDNMLVFAGSLTPILVGLTLVAAQRVGLKRGLA
jgi:hypothetical protein